MFMKKVCCACRRSKGSLGWRDQAVEHCKGVTYGVCPNCYISALEKIQVNYATDTEAEKVLPARRNEPARVGWAG